MRRLAWLLIRKLLFLLDAETAHLVTLRLIQVGARLGNIPLRVAAGRAPELKSRPEVFGMEFLSRVGLAAGFDKDGEILPALPALGFGFVEIGTVTPRPQPGNPRPRLFRDPRTRTVFNRMGFNGLGASIVARNLAQARSRLPEGFRVGVNIGKNKDTPLEQAADDYARAAAAFEGLADYLVINVSSPNTPGLRSLQNVEALKPIVGGVHAALARWKSRTPLLLKLAPEVRGSELEELLFALEPLGIDGWVLTNTLGGSWSGLDGPLLGGLSGIPLTERSLASLIEARARTRLPIISVGGIMTPEDAARRIAEGAALVQLYSGWIFSGPTFPVEVARRLALT